MENNKTPSIRFKGFTDPWEQRKLGELVDRVVRKNTNNESTLPLTISAQYGLVDQITYFNNRVASRDVSNYYLVLNGEFAYNKSTSDGYPFGAVKRLDLYEKGVLSTLYIVFAPKKEQQIDSDYLTVFFDTDRWHKGVAERAAEGARNHGLLNISAEDFFDIDLSVPKDIVEQKQIGAFIRQLDNLITLHQRKYNKLLNVKKSMLEKMFPKNGSNIPEIRFKGFTDPWEQRKVLDLLELLTDYDANGSFADMAKNINTTDGDGYAWYVRITDLENPKPLSELKYVDESSYEFLKKTELHGGELLMAKRGNIGKVYIFEPRTKYATVAPNMYLLKLNNKVIPHFLYDYFVSEEGNKKLTRLNASSTMGALYKDDVKNIDVIMPSIEEQAMIGNFFQSIDHIITLHQREF